MIGGDKRRVVSSVDQEPLTAAKAALFVQMDGNEVSCV